MGIRSGQTSGGRGEERILRLKDTRIIRSFPGDPRISQREIVFRSLDCSPVRFFPPIVDPRGPAEVSLHTPPLESAALSTILNPVSLTKYLN